MRRSVRDSGCSLRACREADRARVALRLRLRHEVATGCTVQSAEGLADAELTRRCDGDRTSLTAGCGAGPEHGKAFFQTNARHAGWLCQPEAAAKRGVHVCRSQFG